MHIISRKALKDFSRKHPQSETSLDSWYRVAKEAQWSNLAEVKKTYPSADLVGKYVVFNIKGNDYRLIVSINFRSKTIFIKNILTHSDYDKGKWKT
ncbi:MAG: type II toxin-antitoxin system HigB family toxin [Symploca sp. SIO3C6]|uniref:Type II toxin-antitoxin system HigB family toxin n=1 Tax=Symploca sp. SIO1C4 TaxID=2607765 RepID=A0A6B3NDF3_9CYAN|nr:type II toxin-antitoxin system HigB family toxin [Symploca sp. SIO3C6]NER27661.1 type II toxin-antitoxin system HigB family toxin [Symploca sp. SIO1C4]NET05589.1 type II toxin-antitoxin system HigB family toxin [Symploca sp. SIO2B6]NET51851.1 type II toxin-antitoxin system HigB family toxin [Merismopedia sp. SIO2A8]